MIISHLEGLTLAEIFSNFQTRSLIVALKVQVN